MGAFVYYNFSWKWISFLFKYMYLGTELRQFITPESFTRNK
mgnify:CR=1 FL=1